MAHPVFSTQQSDYQGKNVAIQRTSLQTVTKRQFIQHARSQLSAQNSLQPSATPPPDLEDAVKQCYQALDIDVCIRTISQLNQAFLMGLEQNSTLATSFIKNMAVVHGMHRMVLQQCSPKIVSSADIFLCLMPPNSLIHQHLAPIADYKKCLLTLTDTIYYDSVVHNEALALLEVLLDIHCRSFIKNQFLIQLVVNGEVHKLPGIENTNAYWANNTLLSILKSKLGSNLLQLHNNLIQQTSCGNVLFGFQLSHQVINLTRYFHLIARWNGNCKLMQPSNMKILSTN